MYQKKKKSVKSNETDDIARLPLFFSSFYVPNPVVVAVSLFLLVRMSWTMMLALSALSIKRKNKRQEENHIRNKRTQGGSVLSLRSVFLIIVISSRSLLSLVGECVSVSVSAFSRRSPLDSSHFSSPLRGRPFLALFSFLVLHSHWRRRDTQLFGAQHLRSLLTSSPFAIPSSPPFTRLSSTPLFRLSLQSYRSCSSWSPR